MQNQFVGTPEQEAYKTKIRTLSETANDGHANPVDHAAILLGGAKESAKEVWRIDPALRQEFRGDFDSFAAYTEGVRDGSIRIIGGRQNIRHLES